MEGEEGKGGETKTNLSGGGLSGQGISSLVVWRNRKKTRNKDGPAGSKGRARQEGKVKETKVGREDDGTSQYNLRDAAKFSSRGGRDTAFHGYPGQETRNARQESDVTGCC